MSVGYLSICRPPPGAPAARNVSTRVGAAAEEAAKAAAAAEAEAATIALGAGGDGRPGAIPAVHEMYHLDAASLVSFEEAAAVATRALGDLLTHIGGGGGGGGDGDGGDGGSGGDGGRGKVGNIDDDRWGDRAKDSRKSALMSQQGVALLLLGVDGGGGRGDGGGGAIVEAISDVRDSFRELVVAATALGVVVPCAPEGAGRKGTVALCFAHACVDRFSCDLALSWLCLPLAEKSGPFVRHGLVSFSVVSPSLLSLIPSEPYSGSSAGLQRERESERTSRAPLDNTSYFKSAPSGAVSLTT